MKRTALYLALLIAYGVALERRLTPAAGALDALSPRARQIERAIAAGRHDDAVPLVLELRASYPRDALVAYWEALVYHGLARPAEEAAAWERFIGVGSAAAEACPDMAEAYARIGTAEQALGAFKRCADLDPHDPERLVDWGGALEQLGKSSEALAVYRRAAALDPGHPVIAKRIERLTQRLAAQP